LSRKPAASRWKLTLLIFCARESELVNPQNLILPEKSIDARKRAS
jgi:hypothetical protein